MELNNILLEKKSDILKKWFDAILGTYPAETSSFLKNQKNQFANPIGATISHGIEGIFNEILQQKIDSARVSSYLDNIIKVRAIQDFGPSQAVSFLFALKKVIREEIGYEIHENRLSDGLLKLDSLIDDLALLSFDIYMKCREKIFEIKANEVKNMTFRLLQKAELLNGNQEQESGNRRGNVLSLNKKGGK